MRPILVASSALAVVAVVAGSVGAQQTQATAKQASEKIYPLETIVAVVGDQPITRFDLQEAFLAKLQGGGVPEPKTHEDTLAIQRDVLNDMIDEELLLQKAKELKIEVTDAEISPQVDAQVRTTRARFSTESEYRNALAQASLGTPEEYRKYLMDQYRRRATHDKTLAKLEQDGKIVPVNVSEKEIEAEFNAAKPYLGPKPAEVTFKQIVIAPQPTQKAKDAARIKAESLYVQLKAGADFERMAKRESMDLQSKDLGGDMGWMRRGENLPEFDRWLFGTNFIAPLDPGQISPVFETPYGYYIVRIDRRQTGEVKASDILIAPVIDSVDIARTKVLADSVARVLKSGVPFDTLAKRYHDYAGKEETSIQYYRDSLPAAYQAAFEGKKAGDVFDFQIPGAALHPNIPKFVVAHLMTVDEGGPRTLDEMRSAVRKELAERGGVRRYVDGLRKQTYVSVRLDTLDVADTKSP